jgi:hypothetical protein
MSSRSALAVLTRSLAASLVILSVVSSAARAHEEFLGATLTNANEPPVNGQPVTPRLSDGVTLRPVSFGNAIFVLNDAHTALTMTARIFNIDVDGTQTTDTNDNLAAAHIHIYPGPPGAATAPVRWGFFGTPDNDINPDNLVVTKFEEGVGGVFTSTWDLNEGNNTTLGDQLTHILAGDERAYLNFHTVQYPGGEVRGPLVPVPEPAGIALLGSGVLCVAYIAVRRRIRKRG